VCLDDIDPRSRRSWFVVTVVSRAFHISSLRASPFTFVTLPPRVALCIQLRGFPSEKRTSGRSGCLGNASSTSVIQYLPSYAFICHVAGKCRAFAMRHRQVPLYFIPRCVEISPASLGSFVLTICYLSPPMTFLRECFSRRDQSSRYIRDKTPKTRSRWYAATLTKTESKLRSIEAERKERFFQSIFSIQPACTEISESKTMPKQLVQREAFLSL